VAALRRTARCVVDNVWTQSLNSIVAATGITPSAVAIAALMTFGAAYVRGMSGFGMAIILVPLLGMVIRPEQAVILAIFLQVLIGPVGITRSIAASAKPSTFIIAAAAVVATPLGLWLLLVTPHDIARILIAVIAIGAFVLVILPKRKTDRPGSMLTIATGLLAGVLTGFAAMPGPPVVPYYMQQDITPHTARASMMTVFFATAIAGTVSAVISGLGSMAMAALAVLLFIPMLIGNWLGGKAFGKINPILWRTGVAVLLGIAGISAIFRAI
jgi:uncharacterized protein